MRPGRTLLLACAAALGAALVALPGAASTHARRSVSLVERDFQIRAPASIKAGDIRLKVRNNGPDTHELIVIHAGRGPLPLRTDGLTVDEERLDRLTVGGVEGQGPGQSRTVDLHLAPGQYVLFCNMAGHYLGGMHTTLVVR